MNAPSNSSCNNENQDKDVVTMLDVLEEENELEEDANAVLGGADDKICTYSKVIDSSYCFFYCPVILL